MATTRFHRAKSSLVGRIRSRPTRIVVWHGLTMGDGKSQTMCAQHHGSRSHCRPILRRSQ